MNAGRYLIRLAVALSALGWWCVSGAAWAQAAGDSTVAPPVPVFGQWAAMRTPGLVPDARARQIGNMGLEALFADALSSGTVAENYTAVREEIVSRGGAEDFLKEKAGIGGVSTAGSGRPTSGGLPGTAGGAGATSETVAQVRARVLARAMLSWGHLGEYNAYRTSYLLETLMKCGSRRTFPGPGFPMSQVPYEAWHPFQMATDRLDDMPPWMRLGPLRPAVPGGSPPTSFTQTTVNGLCVITGLGLENDVPVLLEMAMKGPTGNLRSQLELVRPGLPLLEGGRPIVDGAGYRLWARAWAASRLMTSKDPDIVPILVDLMRSDPEPEVRGYAAAGLERRCGAGVDSILAALDDPDPGVRILLFKALIMITGQQYSSRTRDDARDTKQAAFYRAWWAQHRAEFATDRHSGWQDPKQ